MSSAFGGGQSEIQLSSDCGDRFHEQKIKMNISFAVVLILTVANVSSGVQNSATLFTELFKTITNALIASGANGPPRQTSYPSESNGISSSVYSALQTITKNDDLECVPRLLCEAIAGGKPGGGRQLNIDKYSLSKLISYLQLDSTNSSPMLTFGKAAVLGLSNRGDPYSCIINYPRCPKDETRLLYYLNNHRGGFFRFFDMKQQQYYPSNTYKPNQYYYSRKPVEYHLKAKDKPRYDTYAKKYGHKQFSFPGKENGRKVSFPSDSEPRIQTKAVEYKRPVDSFVFSTSQRYGKASKDTGFFPYNVKSVTGPTHLVTDRLPNRFHFPGGNDAYHMKFPDDDTSTATFFPNN